MPFCFKPNSRSEKIRKMYLFSPTSRPKRFRVMASWASEARSLVLAGVSMAWMIFPVALTGRCSLNPYTQPMAPWLCAARPCMVRSCRVRLGWKAASGVESTMETPVHRPWARPRVKTHPRWKAFRARQPEVWNRTRMVITSASDIRLARRRAPPQPSLWACAYRAASKSLETLSIMS